MSASATQGGRNKLALFYGSRCGNFFSGHLLYHSILTTLLYHFPSY